MIDIKAGVVLVAAVIVGFVAWSFMPVIKK